MSDYPVRPNTVTVEQFIEALRSVKTSQLILLLDADGLVRLFRDCGMEGAEHEAGRRATIDAVAAEIDARIPARQADVDGAER